MLALDTNNMYHLIYSQLIIYKNIIYILNIIYIITQKLKRHLFVDHQKLQ